MRYKLVLLFLLLGHFCFSQQFKTLDIERTNVDSNNTIYIKGIAAVYDYEIIENGDKYKLNYNKGFPENKFELVKKSEDTLGLKIYLLIPQIERSERTNKKQTEAYYLFSPTFASFSGTGIVENRNNVWMHPPRSGFFRALETCPFPYVKLPIEIGKAWKDKMKIRDYWCDEKWGIWEKKLLLSYDYKITQKVKIKTKIGELGCYVIEGTAKSRIGESKLKSYFSQKYGFVRLEYEMVTGLKVNLWVDQYSEGNNFNGLQNVAKYMKEQKKTLSIKAKSHGR